MSIIASAGVSLITVAATLGGGWMVTTRVTDHWDQIKKNREMNLAAAHDFQRLYGEFVAIWKTWNALRGNYTAAFTSPEQGKWDCLVRATAAEGEIEALMAQLAAERTLSDQDIDVLGGIRQAFKVLRRKVRRDEPLNWWAADVEEYAAFKSLAAATSVLLATTPPARNRPDAREAAKAFRKITDNRHEITWTTAARHLTSPGDSNSRASSTP
jgi:hypothetical protein